MKHNLNVHESDSDICACSDPHCVCLGECTNESTVTLFRIDMDDEGGTRMCDDCADEAFESGLYRGEYDVEGETKLVAGTFFCDGDPAPVSGHTFGEYVNGACIIYLSESELRKWAQMQDGSLAIDKSNKQAIFTSEIWDDEFPFVKVTDTAGQTIEAYCMAGIMFMHWED